MFCLLLIGVVMCVALCLATLKPKNYPPGPRWFPIKGCVDVLKWYVKKYGGQHIGFIKLAEVYKTNVLGLKLGRDLVVVVFTYELVKHVLKSEDYESRPDNFFIRLRSMGTKKGITCADGELWSSQRNFLIRHLRNLGFGKEKMQKMIQDELNDIYLAIEVDGPIIQIGKLLSPAVISVLWNLTAGCRIRRTDVRLDRVLNLLRKRSKIFDMSGGMLNMYPWLRFITPERSGYKLMVELNEEMKSFFVEVIKEHFIHWTEGKDDDVIYAFITEMKKNVPDSYFTEDQLVMLCADILIAGAQTTSNTLDFAFLTMILREDIQKKVHDALDKAFDKQAHIDYSDRVRVPYVEAFLMEIERFYHVVPITGPRRVLKDVVLEDYTIPKETTVLISNYSVHMDTTFWGDPEVFKPERFLNEFGNLITTDRLIPFGLGKRRCLGESLARSCIFVYFSGIMRNYAISCPVGKPRPTGIPVPGITLTPENYVGIFTKRHPIS